MLNLIDTDVTDGNLSDDNITIGTILDDLIRGDAGDDRLVGREGDDTILGGQGTNVFVGGEGNDTFNATNSSYSIIEESGNYSFTLSNTQLIADDGNGTVYTDTLVGSFNEVHLHATGTGNHTIDVTAFSGGETFIQVDGGINTIYGSQQKDEITGGSERDHIEGKGGNDFIEGLGGNDYLEGNAGRDTIIGGAGVDIIVGGRHVDFLTGGGGHDIFLYNSSDDGGDVIYDFDVNEDIFNIDASGFDPTGTASALSAGGIGGPSIATLVGMIGNLGSSAGFRYDATSGDLFYDSDGGYGVTGTTLLANLSNTPTLADLSGNIHVV
jgi:Ca2+-binding RTX toxin-like protein